MQDFEFTIERNKLKGAVEEMRIRPLGDSQHEPAAGRVPGKKEGSLRTSCTDDAEQVGEVVVELADIVNVPGAPIAAVTAQVRDVYRVTARVQRPRERVHAAALSRRSMDEHDGVAPVPGIAAIV